MAERLCDDLIRTIQDHNDIVELISGFIQLKKSGRNFKALCPFHSEKTPSFYVNPDKQIFHCFGCGIGGNVFSFLMKHNQMNFIEAIRFLAEKKGIEIPKSSFSTRQSSDLARDIIKVNEMAAVYFEQSLKESREGSIALAYLQTRQIKTKTIEKMRLGYASLKWDGLSSYAHQQKVPFKLLEKAALISPRKDKNGYYDYFRKRIVFPIFNVTGRIVAFGARVLDNTVPKYLNSPQTAVFNKSEVLYGLNFAKESIQKSRQVLIVEGYFDFITLYQAGITNVVASSGTSLTEGQIRLLKRFVKEVILIFDPDTAGESAAQRGIELLLSHQFQVRIVSLKGGLDPDAFIQKNGKDAFLAEVHSASGFFEYNLNRLMERHNLETTKGKVEIVEAMLSWVKLVDNSIEKREMIRLIAERLKLEEADVMEEFNKLFQKNKKIAPAKSTPLKQSLDAEESLIKLVLEKKENFKQIKKEICPQDFCDDGLREIAETIWRYDGENDFPSVQFLINFIAGEKNRDKLTSIMLNKTVFYDEFKAGGDCIKYIKKKRRLKRQKEIEREIKLAEDRGEDLTINSLLVEYQSLIKSN